VFLSAGGARRAVAPLPASADLIAYAAEERFQYVPGDDRISLTDAACAAVVERGDVASARFDPRLVE
jgi:hypothetical protein